MRDFGPFPAEPTLPACLSESDFGLYPPNLKICQNGSREPVPGSIPGFSDPLNPNFDPSGPKSARNRSKWRSHKQKECPNWPFFKAGRYVRRYRSQLVLVQLPGGCQHCIRQRQHFWAWPLDAIRRTRGTARASSNSICIHRINRSAATGSPWEKLIS